MAKEFKLQDPGEGIHEAEIIEIQVSSGDRVQDGDILFVVDTDKAAVEIPAPFDGTVEEIRVEEDQVVEVGDVLLTYAAESDEDGEKEETKGEGEEEEEAVEEEGEESAEKEKEEEEAAGEEEEKRVREEEGEEDEEEARTQEEGPEKEEKGQEKKAAEGEKDRPVPASPATRRLARELEVDLLEVPGSGPQGRVTSGDVRSYAEEGSAGAPEKEEADEPEGAKQEGEPGERETRKEEGAKTEGAPSLPFHTLVKELPPLPDFSHWGPVRTEPLRRVRRNVARRMTMAWMEVPHVNHHQEVDITDLERFRKEHETGVEEEGGQLTLTVMVMKAVVAALKEHPRFNASLDVEAQKIVLKDYYNLGLAVDTPQGLVVPVIRGVDGKSLLEISAEIAETAERVRNGGATPEDIQGGTFTLTNPGAIGGDSFTPILRYPEVGILGMAAARLKPVVRGDLEDWEIVPRLMLPLVLAFDHRVNDGADAARFMNTLVETLGDLDAFLLKS